MWFVYFLKSKRIKWYYVGSTCRLNERLKEHNAGKVFSTKPFLPLTLVHTETFDTEHEARKREKLLKQKRLAKEAVIRHIERRS